MPEGVDPDDREAVAQRSPGARMLSAEATCLKLDWLQAPTPRERLLQFRALKPKERRRQFAAAIARALTPQLAFDPDARPDTEAVVEALDIPFHELYRPDLEHFWRRMGRREMLQVASETLGEQWAEAHETDRKETLAKAMAEAFGKNTPPASLKLADDARQRALRWAPPGFEPARASRRVRPRRHRPRRRAPRLDERLTLPADPTQPPRPAAGPRTPAARAEHQENRPCTDRYDHRTPRRPKPRSASSPPAPRSCAGWRKAAPSTPGRSETP